MSLTLAPRAVPARLTTLWKVVAGTPANAVLSAVLAALILWSLWRTLAWGVLGSEIRPDPDACRAAAGACWGAVVERGRVILLGRFPASEFWRPLFAMTILAGAVCTAALPRFFNRIGLAFTVAGLLAFMALMHGGPLGLPVVTSDLWGGLPLTLFLACVACFFGVPAGILLALARRSRLLTLSWLATGYIELIRAIPLITLLFFGAVVMPLLQPPQAQWDTMARIAFCLVAFEAAYFAEVLRGGLQAIPRGQYEAAHALGLSPLQTIRDIVLPQALRITIPPTVSNVIGVIKNTSLVAVVNIYDLTGSLKVALADPTWKHFTFELYLLVCMIYLVVGAAIGRYGRFLETRYAMHGR